MAQAQRDDLFAVLRPMLDEGKFNVTGRTEALDAAAAAIEAAARFGGVDSQIARERLFDTVRDWLDDRRFNAPGRIEALNTAITKLEEAARGGAAAGAGGEPTGPGLAGVSAAILEPRAETAASIWQEMIDLPLLRIAFPSNGELARWVAPTRAACIRWGIDLPREIASFLANIAVESGDLLRLTESLNYKVEALISMFGRHRISVADAERYGRRSAGGRVVQAANQEALANILYGGEFGRKQLGNTRPGDGWKFRGYGPKQLTGRDNQTRFGQAMGMAVDDVPAYVRTPEGGMMSAGWFWKSRNLDARAATAGIEDDRRAINGGLFGVNLVAARFDDVIEELLEREAAR